MNLEAAIETALRHAGIAARVERIIDLSGGCIHNVKRIDLADSASLVAKINRASMVRVFEEEFAGLSALAATNTVLTPLPLGVSTHGDSAVLLMTALTAATVDESAWRRFGGELAALHGADAGSRYGFETDNHLGATPQPNGWCDDWVQFNAEHRLGYQIRLASDHGLLTEAERRELRAVIDRLDELIPRTPRPALLHGDLWSGNAMATTDDAGRMRIGVIDPACSIGDGWADIAMMRLFGGFPESCLRVYTSQVDDHAQLESRIAVYQLYHVLNHVNLFGRGYIGQTIDLVRRLSR